MLSCQGPPEDQDEEITPEELSTLREQQKIMQEKRRQEKEKLSSILQEDKGESGCSWGMGKPPHSS